MARYCAELFTVVVLNLALISHFGLVEVFNTINIKFKRVAESKKGKVRD